MGYRIAESFIHSFNMSTAHRPTWNAARAYSNVQGLFLFFDYILGGVRKGAFKSQVTHSRDLAAETTLKQRTTTFDANQSLETRAILLERLLSMESKAKDGKINQGILRPIESVRIEALSEQKQLEAASNRRAMLKDLNSFQNPYDDDDDEEFLPAKRVKEGNLDSPSIDDDDSESNESSDSSDESEDESEDEEIALMRELERIKAERRAEADRKATEAKKIEDQIKREEMVRAESSAGTLTRGWTEDTVFKHQSRTIVKSKESTYINDAPKSEFHKKFMNKYIQ